MLCSRFYNRQAASTLPSGNASGTTLCSRSLKLLCVLIIFSTTRPGAIVRDLDALKRNAIVVDRTVDSGPGGRTMDTSIRTGFYSDGYGWLPWWWDDDEIDEYELWRSNRRFEIREPGDPNLSDR